MNTTSTTSRRTREVVETPPASVSSLRRITCLPIDTSDRFYAGYPAFKFGARDVVERYAVALVPLAERVIRASPAHAAWTLTAPPFEYLPAGANLLCWSLSR